MALKLGKQFDKRPRRDLLYFVGLRASKLDLVQSAKAWESLSHLLLHFSDQDMPKFKDILGSIRAATIFAKKGSSRGQIRKTPPPR